MMGIMFFPSLFCKHGLSCILILLGPNRTISVACKEHSLRMDRIDDMRPEAHDRDTITNEKEPPDRKEATIVYGAMRIAGRVDGQWR